MEQDPDSDPYADKIMTDPGGPKYTVFTDPDPQHCVFPHTCARKTPGYAPTHHCLEISWWSRVCVGWGLEG